jgi:hypothetical protein
MQRKTNEDKSTPLDGTVPAEILYPVEKFP